VRLSACNFNRVPSIYGSSVGTELHPVEFPARLHHGRSLSHVYVSPAHTRAARRPVLDAKLTLSTQLLSF